MYSIIMSIPTILSQVKKSSSSKLSRSRRFLTNPSFSTLQINLSIQHLLSFIIIVLIFSLYVILPIYHASDQLPVVDDSIYPTYTRSSFPIPLPPPPQATNFTGPYPPATVAVPVVDAVDLYNERQKQNRLHHRLISQLPKCSKRGRAISFLMVFMGHSGSTALMTSLKQHSKTFITGLEPVDHGKFVSGKPIDNAKLAVQYTKQYFYNATKHQLTAGFKIRPQHIHKQPVEFARLVRKYRTRIVWSFRTNILKQAIGDYAIHYYGDRSSYEGLKIDVKNDTQHTLSTMEKRKKKSFRIDNMNKLYKLMKSRVYGDRQVARALRYMRSDGCVLPVSYESYLKHPELTLERIQRFLGLGTKEMHPALRQKANQDSICDLVENWEDICEAFFGCVQWRWMLDDFENGCSCSSLNPSQFKKKSFCKV